MGLIQVWLVNDQEQQVLWGKDTTFEGAIAGMIKSWDQSHLIATVKDKSFRAICIL